MSNSATKLMSIILFCSTFFLSNVQAEIIDCTLPELKNAIDPAIQSQMKGNLKEGSLRSCSMDLGPEHPVLSFLLFGRSKDQTVIRIGFGKVTKTLYNVAFDLSLDFSVNPETCELALIRDDLAFHSEGIFVSHVVRGILEVGRSEIRQKLREVINQKIKEKEQEFKDLCDPPFKS